MSIISEYIDAVIPKKHEFGTSRQKKRAIDEYFDQMISLSEDREYLRMDGLANPILERRKRALLNFLSQPDEVLQEFGVKGREDRLLFYEVAPYTAYDVMDEDYYISLAAALWILDDLNRSGKLIQAYQYLPDNVYVPWDLVHHSYSYNLIMSVIYVLEHRHDGRYFIIADESTAARPDNWETLPKSENRKNFEGLMSLLDEERVRDACRKFEEIHLGVVRRFLDCTALIHEKTIRMAEELRRQEQSSVLLRSTAVDAGSMELLGEIDRNQKKIKTFINEFPYLLSAEEDEIRQYVGSRKLTKIMQGIRIDDPYEICFALYALIDRGSDTPWLFSSSLAVIEAAASLLPWRYSEPEFDEEFWSEEDTAKAHERVEKLNQWKQKKMPDPVDLYHTKYDFRGEKKNLAQIVFEISDGLLTPGAHPYDNIRQELISSGMDESIVNYLSGISEMMFFTDRKYTADNLRGKNSLWSRIFESDEDDKRDDSEKEDTKQQERSDSAENSEDGEADTEKDSDTAAQELIRRLRRENKNLKKVLSESGHAYGAELEKAERELKSLRREHRELADLREIVFNRENDISETQAEHGFSFPYHNEKKTVVFGGHDSFLRAIRPLLPDVRFVDPSNLSFDTMLLKNVEVIWIQNNCISHSQYWKVIAYARRYGIQVRYFVYAGAENCAAQLAEEDRKGEM